MRPEPDYRVAVESLPHMVWACAGDGPCDYLSPQWVAYTGIPEVEQLGYRWLEQLHPDDVEPTKARWGAAAAQGGVFDTEFRIRRHDGAYRWFKTRAVPQRGPDGAIARWFGTNTDIQELKDAQEATALLAEQLRAQVGERSQGLNDAHRQLATLALQLETAQRITQVGSWEADLVSGEVTWSAELFRVFGLPPARRAPPFEAQAAIFAPESWSRLSQQVARSAETGEGYELELTAVSADGEHRRTIARAEAIRGPDGRVTRLVGTFQDITQREQTRERLRVLSERLSLATSAAHIGVWEWNVLTGELTWDDAMFSLYGVADVGQPVSFDLWKSKLHADDAELVLNEVAAALRSGRRFDSAFRIVQAKGDVRHLKVAAVVGLDAAGQATRMVGVNWDVTEQRTAELALRERDAFQRALLEHAGPAVIATDTDGTITLFNRSAELLLGYPASELIGHATPAVFHDPDEVHSRRLELELELGVPLTDPFEVFVARSRTCTPRRGGVARRVELSLDVEPVALPVEQAIPLGLVLNELLTNALKHAFPPGRPGRVHVGLANRGGVLELSVQEDGVGLAPKPPGRRESLGLQLVRDLTDQLAADFAQPPVAVGTRFVVALRPVERSSHVA